MAMKKFLEKSSTFKIFVEFLIIERSLCLEPKMI